MFVDRIAGRGAHVDGEDAVVGAEGRVVVEVIMAATILTCMAIAAWGAAKQRLGASTTRDSFAAEQVKG